MLHFMSLHPDLQYVLLTNLDVILFVDGSYGKNGNQDLQADYTVTMQYVLLERGNLPYVKSIQQPELYTLTGARQLSK